MRLALLTLSIVISVATLADETRAVEKNTLDIPHTEETFENARRFVKAHYVGMDDVIDSVFAQIKTWYLLPETRTRPLVVGIWGLTGTGKTSFLRLALQKLGLERALFYVDMQKCAGDAYLENFHGLISHYITGHKKLTEDISVFSPAIPEDPVFLLDEFQKINSRDPSGSLIDRSAAQGFWEMLGNDGKLTVHNHAHKELQKVIDSEFLEGYLYLPRADGGGHSMSFSNRDGKDSKLPEQKARMVEDAKRLIRETPSQHTLDFGKSLVFVVGNLDIAFPGVHTFDPESLNADRLHQLTKQLRPTDIRSGLGLIFRPEHVARLGNRHITVPTLSEAQYRAYLDRELDEISGAASKAFGIAPEFTPRFKDRLYHEAVVPSQGIRPIRAVIEAFASDPLGEIYARLGRLDEKDAPTPVRVRVDLTPKSSTANWKILSGPWAGLWFHFGVPSEFLESTLPYEEPLRSLLSVRQAALTTLLIAVDGDLPLAVYSRSRAGRKLGHIEQSPRPDGEVHFRSDLIREIAKNLAAYVGEKMVFGEASLASTDQLKAASQTAYSMVNQGGLGDSKVPSLLFSRELPRSGDLAEREGNDLMAEAQSFASSVLKREFRFFRALTERLHEKVFVKHRELKELMKVWVGAPNEQNPCHRRVQTFLKSEKLNDLPRPRAGFQ